MTHQICRAADFEGAHQQTGCFRESFLQKDRDADEVFLLQIETEGTAPECRDR
jgi:hypothetical protein